MIRRRVPGVLHGAHHRDVELARGEQVVELGGGAADELRPQRDEAPVHRAVDRVAVDPGNPAQAEGAHAACTTGAPAPAVAKPGGRSSRWSRTRRWRLAR